MLVNLAVYVITFKSQVQAALERARLDALVAQAEAKTARYNNIK